MTNEIRDAFERIVMKGNQIERNDRDEYYLNVDVDTAYLHFQAGYQARANHDKERLREVRDAIYEVTSSDASVTAFLAAQHSARQAVEILNEMLSDTKASGRE